MICLPSVAESEGVCLLTPPTENSVIVSLLESLGGVVQAENEKQMSAVIFSSDKGLTAAKPAFWSDACTIP